MDATSTPNASGIYRIIHIASGKSYIGSALNLRKRRNKHFQDLRRNVHHSPTLQRAWNKYGEASFTFEILELVLLPELLTAREQYYFSKLRPFGSRGYNIARIAGSTLGMPAHNRGVKASPLAIERRKRAMLDYKPSEETKRKQAESRRGKKRSPETRAKISLAQLGRTKGGKDYIVTDPEGNEYSVHNLKAFCSTRQLHAATLVEVAKGKRQHHKGWKARYP